MEKKERIAAIIREHVTFDPTKGLQGVEAAADKIAEIGMWVCVDDEKRDWGGAVNWARVSGIKKGDVLEQRGDITDTCISFVGRGYIHDISKFKQL